MGAWGHLRITRTKSGQPPSPGTLHPSRGSSSSMYAAGYSQESSALPRALSNSSERNSHVSESSPHRSNRTGLSEQPHADAILGEAQHSFELKKEPCRRNLHLQALGFAGAASLGHMKPPAQLRHTQNQPGVAHASYQPCSPLSHLSVSCQFSSVPRLFLCIVSTDCHFIFRNQPLLHSPATFPAPAPWTISCIQTDTRHAHQKRITTIGEFQKTCALPTE